MERSEVLWQVFPLGALGTPSVNAKLDGTQPDSPPRHTLADLVPWCDHAANLGATGILLGPIFDSYSHGYDTVDHYTIDPRLGTRDDFGTLVHAAHAKGLKVVLDGVFNHVGSRHPYLLDLAQNGPRSEYADFFRVNWQGWSVGSLPQYDTFEGHTGLAALNHEHPGVLTYIQRVMTYWLDAGADGWRLDAAYALDPATWTRILPPVREQFPKAWFCGEVIHGDYPALVRASGWDSLTEYELWKATWSSLRERNFFELDWTLRRHNEFLDTFVPQTFVSNHDVTRIVSQVHGDAQALTAAVILFTVGGIPSIYYGDEFGWGGVKEERLGGDDAIRPPLPDSLKNAAWNAREKEFLRAYKELVALRAQHPWLMTARTHVEYLDNEQIRYSSKGANGQALTVVLNTASTPVPLDHEMLSGIRQWLLSPSEDGLHHAAIGYPQIP
ncbi:alpha-amylase family glycosyl hydrolase [Gleimia hominis]|uniref:Alpha-amylase family glycosyl hydrolase n=1 Tax=Gleimia hominis TaxID=595468 RepID=A0ABU3IAN0_9ACTO|nr:alpha-amylase family glycosyl hydrolase [Gleimia hominis]MDT3767432.1 alpha-amylase family glycosyl hydrolase [Gleimia hominis]